MLPKLNSLQCGSYALRHDEIDAPCCLLRGSPDQSCACDELHNRQWMGSRSNNGRGTFSIVSSCLLTLSLCVYTAVHLNVPQHGDLELRGWLRTARWVLFGILAPELILYTAWRQFRSVCALERSIKAELAKHSLQDAIESSTERAEVLISWLGAQFTV